MILTACPLQNLTTNATAALTAGIARQKKWRKLKTRTTRQFLHVREGMLYLKLKTLKTLEKSSTVTDVNFPPDKLTELWRLDIGVLNVNSVIWPSEKFWYL